MDGHLFLSYSAVDGADFALQLADALASGPPAYPVWLDRRDLQPGEDWDEQIAEALQTCRAVLFVMTEDSVEPGSVCKQEWGRALKYKKPVIPLRLDADAELPFRLGARQYIDFSNDFATGLARLRQYLAWTGTPKGVLAELKVRLAEAKRELSRCRPERRPQIEAEITELRRRIQDQQRLIDSPSHSAGTQ